MKLYITILLACTISFLSAQDWELVNKNSILNFSQNNSGIISNTILVDSFNSQGNDTIFYLNKVVVDCSNCDLMSMNAYKLANQEQFLKTSIIKQNNGDYKFIGNNSFVIKPMLQIGSSWLFDSNANIEAKIDTGYTDEIFGIIDSIKMITTSNFDTILISKEFGIIEFNSNENIYTLRGINNRLLGDIIPNKAIFFDYEIGDIHLHRFFSFSLNSQFKGIRKTIILDKIETDSHFFYTANIISRDSFIYEFEPDFYVYRNDTLNLPINKFPSDEDDSKYYNIFHNPYPNKLIPENDEFYYKTLEISTDNNSVISFSNKGFSHSSNSVELPYSFQPQQSDTLIPQNDYFIANEKTVYTTNLGLTYKKETIIDNGTELWLIAYVLNGDTIGTVIPDEDFIITSNSTIPEHEFISISPTLSQGIFFIQNANTGYFSVIDVSGNLIFNESDITSNRHKIDLSHLPNGIYFINIRAEKYSKTFKVMKLE